VEVTNLVKKKEMETKQKKLNFKYKQQYGIIVICRDEEEQKELYKKLQEMGLKLKVVCV
jgi:hypothetical protein